MTLQKNLSIAMENYGTNFATEFGHRHPGTQHMIKVLAPNINLPSPLFEIDEEIFELAINAISRIPDGPELTAGLRHLLEAKDSLIRAALDD